MKILKKTKSLTCIFWIFLLDVYVVIHTFLFYALCVWFILVFIRSKQKKNLQLRTDSYTSTCVSTAQLKIKKKLLIKKNFWIELIETLSEKYNDTLEIDISINWLTTTSIKQIYLTTIIVTNYV